MGALWPSCREVGLLSETALTTVYRIYCMQYLLSISKDNGDLIDSLSEKIIFDYMLLARGNKLMSSVS